jgi:hypothetical protein
MKISAIRVHEAVIGLVIFLSGVLTSLHVSTVAGDLVASGAAGIWFGADTPATFSALTSAGADPVEAHAPAAAMILGRLLVEAMVHVAGLSDLAAVRVLFALVTGASAVLFYASARALAIRRGASVLFTGLFLVSAGVLFRSGMPDLELVLAFAGCLILCLTAFGQRAGQVVWTLAGGLAVAMAPVMLIAGLVATSLTWERRQALRIVLFALAWVLALDLLPGLLHLSAQSFWDAAVLGNAFGADTGVPGGGDWSLVGQIWSLAIGPVVAAPSDVVKAASGQLVLWQGTYSLAGADVLTILATIAWVLLLGLGGFSAVRHGHARRVDGIIAVILVIQTVLQIASGPAPGPSSPMVLPWLVVLVVIACRGPFRALVMGVAIPATILFGVSNLRAFDHAIETFQTRNCDWSNTARSDYCLEMTQRPGDFWPRNIGLALLARPGSKVEGKGYLLPGGSFSPAPGSFGVSIWVIGSDGRVEATSDTIPLSDTRSTYDLEQTAIRITTPFYHLTWRVEAAGFSLSLQNLTGNGRHLELVIRSAGPGGGPIPTLSLQGSSLRVGQDWELSDIPDGALRFLGREGEEGWQAARGKAALSATDPSGWVAARVALSDGASAFHIARLGPDDPSATVLPDPNVIGISGLDELSRQVEAQVATLVYGLVGVETRPGDPVYYPLEWLRDGAYVIVALARSGNVELAKRLALAIGGRDFFGGFGSEADAPGLSIWAMVETSRLARSPQFDAAIWPHVRRKAEMIVQMIETTAALSAPFSGPVVPSLAGAEGLEVYVLPPDGSGLINGKMDQHYPQFFVTAVSYLGLREAAWLAGQRGELGAARSWTSHADRLQATWQAAFAAGHPDRQNERTLAAGLWPSGIADPAAFRDLLVSVETEEAPPSAPRRPWTYFEVAHAHQWLRLGQPDRAWKAMQDLYAQSGHPGLYTLWEGPHENSFNLWDHYRGWDDDRAVEPHYWSAAEALLFAIEALVYEDREAGTLVIGAGLLPDWLSGEIAVGPVQTGYGKVRWQWSRPVLTVWTEQSGIVVRPGSSFPKDATVRVLGWTD